MSKPPSLESPLRPDNSENEIGGDLASLWAEDILKYLDVDPNSPDLNKAWQKLLITKLQDLAARYADKRQFATDLAQVVFDFKGVMMSDRAVPDVIETIKYSCEKRDPDNLAIQRLLGPFGEESNNVTAACQQLAEIINALGRIFFDSLNERP